MTEPADEGASWTARKRDELVSFLQRFTDRFDGGDDEDETALPEPHDRTQSGPGAGHSEDLD